MIFSLVFLRFVFIFYQSNVECVKFSGFNKFKINDNIITGRIIRFENSNVTSNNESRCTSFQFNENDVQYITSIIPNNDQYSIKYMSLTACESLPNPVIQNNGNTWLCDDKTFSVCGGNKFKIIFKWTPNAPGFDLPDGVGFKVGGNLLPYLVLQVKYGKALPVNQLDSTSGVVFKVTTQSLPYQAAIYNLGNNGILAPKITEFKFDSGCEINLPYDFVPIFYRGHTNSLGTVVSGYLVKNKNLWTELGRVSPKKPQSFLPVSNSNLTVSNGDILASRCVYNTASRDDAIFIGDSDENEKCEFSLIYYTEYDGSIEDISCINQGNQFGFFKSLALSSGPPEKSTSLSGLDF